MIVRSITEITNTDRTMSTANWTSRRLILADDGVGFSLHDTVLRAGTSTDMWYANHIEAVYCVDGYGELLDKESGVVHPIEAGTMYLLDGHERHRLTCHTDLRMVCVFNPPLVGPETHDRHGTYPLMAPAAGSAS